VRRYLLGVWRGLEENVVVDCGGGGGRTYGVEEFAERFAAPSADKADVKDVVHRRFLLP
jgi:hypothetical protein